jgi:hypothetical protein
MTFIILCVTQFTKKKTLKNFTARNLNCIKMQRGLRKYEIEISVLRKPQTVKYVTESSALFKSVTADIPLHTVYYRMSVFPGTKFSGDIIAFHNCH